MTPSETAARPGETVDVFHRGGFVLVQPANKGHRAGMDAMMLAAAVPSGFSGRLADLGAGAGAAGLAVLSRCKSAEVMLVERAPDMADFARRSISHPANAALSSRASVIECDVTLTGSTRRAAGLADNSFDFAIMNPPFNAPHDRSTPDALKRDAHVMEDGLLEGWVRTAAAIVRPRGGLAAIARPESLGPLLAAMQGRFGAAEIMPIHPREDRPAIRIVVRATRGARRGPAIMPPLVLHDTRPATAMLRAPAPSATAAPRSSATDRSPPRLPLRFGDECLHAMLKIGGFAHVREFFARLLPKSMRSDAVTIPVVRLNGTIQSGGTQFRQNLSLATAAGVLQKAFGIKDAPAVAISINSPGGSPVQSRLIYRRIRDLATEKNKTVIVFVEDVAASGGYMIALAGDEIVADPSSIVGSIGVVSASFGFTELMKKVGVERRVYTAGKNKAVLDPFRPENKEDVERLKQLQLEVHDTFIDMVKERRGSKLKDDPDLFTGLFWTGRRGLELGLVDGLGDMRSWLKERFGAKTKMRLISPPRGLFGRRLGFFGIGGGQQASEIAAAAASGLIDAAEERALWSRFGL